MGRRESVKFGEGKVEPWMISFKLPDTPEVRENIALALKHDFLLYEGKGMNAENLSEWMRFLINRRLTDIKFGRN